MLRPLPPGGFFKSGPLFARFRSCSPRPRLRLPNITSARFFLKSSTRRTQDAPRANDVTRILTSNLAFATTLILSSHLVLTYFYTLSLTWGPSMLPTIAADGTTAVLISKRHRRGRDCAVGDLVSFQHPVAPGMRAIKRIVGLPGDFVVRDTPVDAMPAGTVQRSEGNGADAAGPVSADGDGDDQTDRTVLDPLAPPQMMIQVPKGHVYVVGDNLHHSRDSRMFGPLPLALIKGKVVYTLAKSDWFWPKKVQSGLVDVLESGQQ